MYKQIQGIMGVLSIITFNGCNSSSATTTGNTGTTNATLTKGYLVDSPLKGVSYSCGTITGVTTSTGEFLV